MNASFKAAEDGPPLETAEIIRDTEKRTRRTCCDCSEYRTRLRICLKAQELQVLCARTIDRANDWRQKEKIDLDT